MVTRRNRVCTTVTELSQSKLIRFELENTSGGGGGAAAAASQPGSQAVERLNSSVCEMLSVAGIYRFTADLSSTYAIYVMRRSSSRTGPCNKGEKPQMCHIRTRCAARWSANNHCALQQ